MKHCRFTFAKKEAYSRQMVALLQKDSPYLAAVNKQLTNEWYSLRLQLHFIIFQQNIVVASTWNTATHPAQTRSGSENVSSHWKTSTANEAE
jgi:hypothetical protein